MLRFAGCLCLSVCLSVHHYCLEVLWETAHHVVYEQTTFSFSQTQCLTYWASSSTKRLSQHDGTPYFQPATSTRFWSSYWLVLIATVQLHRTSYWSVHWWEEERCRNKKCGKQDLHTVKEVGGAALCYQFLWDRSMESFWHTTYHYPRMERPGQAAK